MAETRVSGLLSAQTVGDLVAEVATVLARASIVDDPIDEARNLVSALLDVPRHWPILRANKWVDSIVWQRAMSAARRRASGAPLAYAVGRANFRQLTLDVDERVLIPRPETELLVDLVLARVSRGVAMDVGTGSGAIAIALATEGSFDRVLATDISADALDVARGNATRCGARNVEFRASDLLRGIDARRGPRFQANVVVSNPPYIAHEEVVELPRSVRDWEPAVALTSGGNGLATTFRLVRQAATVLAPRGLLALEVDARRASLAAERIATDPHYTDVAVHLDLSGRERFVLATRSPHR